MVQISGTLDIQKEITQSVRFMMLIFPREVWNFGVEAGRWAFGSMNHGHAHRGGFS